MKQHSQRGLSLTGVLILSMVIGGAVALALISARNERNLFAEMWGKLSGSVREQPAVQDARQALGAASPAAEASGAPLRKCTIDGKTVYSNTDCKASNPTSKEIQVQRTAGIASPKAAPAGSSASATSDPALDKAIEKQFK
ncbi:DUF4124 domain-containing protein [Massilia sp. TS11]|uniref:DUF4124 domain-containing protein n=1 Tax=Massilia sp. TS11 TaxID=2908003 RepID=UPI001EDC184E|nr:DUF4124 domain-containing protein [Massilia sp. TS11]MCG2583448.1 DUF4124 domain-containing protein [Massilia sp. TS11]